jgi:hypothetical protein
LSRPNHHSHSNGEKTQGEKGELFLNGVHDGMCVLNYSTVKQGLEEKKKKEEKNGRDG